MNCKDKGYEEGQAFKTISKKAGDTLEKDSIIILTTDDNSSSPWFKMIDGDTGTYGLYNENPVCLNRLKRIWPPEKETVSITCEGKTVEISRESAKALNLL